MDLTKSIILHVHVVVGMGVGPGGQGDHGHSNHHDCARLHNNIYYTNLGPCTEAELLLVDQGKKLFLHLKHILKTRANFIVSKGVKLTDTEHIVLLLHRGKTWNACVFKIERPTGEGRNNTRPLMLLSTPENEF